MSEWILVLYIWTGAHQHCNGRSDGGMRCWPEGGTSTVTTIPMGSKVACEEAAKPFYEWMKPKDYRSQGPENVLHQCVRRGGK